MTATIGMSLRLSTEEHEALDRIAPRGKKNEFVRGLVRRELTRRGALGARNPPKHPKGNR